MVRMAYSHFEVPCLSKFYVIWSKRLINFTIEQTNYIKQHFLQGVMFNISFVLISIPRSTINDTLSKFHSLTKVWNLLVYIVSFRIID